MELLLALGRDVHRGLRVHAHTDAHRVTWHAGIAPARMAFIISNAHRGLRVHRVTDTPTAATHPCRLYSDANGIHRFKCAQRFART